MKLHDELCKDCPNKVIKSGNLRIPCPHPCRLIIWIDGNVGLKERLLKYPLESRNYSDYNNVLAELIAGHNKEQMEKIRKEQMEKIREITDIKIRAIAAMLYADISLSDIARLLKADRANLYKSLSKTYTPKIANSSK